MAKINPSTSRVTVTDGPSGLGLLIPPKRNWFIILFMGFWLCLWAAGEIMVPIQFLKGEIPGITEVFVLAWLGVWTVGGAFAIYLWLWNLMGRQIITMHGDTLTARRDMGGYGFSKEYDLTHVRDLRVSARGSNAWDYSASLEFLGLGGGLVAFDYDAKTYRLGAGLDEAEAKLVVKKITDHYSFAKSNRIHS
jgi:hypothetical protein